MSASTPTISQPGVPGAKAVVHARSPHGDRATEAAPFAGRATVATCEVGQATSLRLLGLLAMRRRFYDDRVFSHLAGAQRLQYSPNPFVQQLRKPVCVVGSSQKLRPFILQRILAPICG